MLGTVYWNSDALPTNATLDRVLYDIRRDDGDDGLIFDAVTEADILSAPSVESILSLDALTSPYSKLERKMQIMLQVMERSSGEVKPVILQGIQRDQMLVPARSLLPEGAGKCRGESRLLFGLPERLAALK